MSRATIAVVGPIVAAVLGGMASAHLFVQGWLAACDLAIVLIALLRGRLAGEKLFGAIVASLVSGVVYSVCLRLTYWAVFDVLGVGRNVPATVVYWAIALNFTAFVARRAPAKVRKSWDGTMARPTEVNPS